MNLFERYRKYLNYVGYIIFALLLLDIFLPLFLDTNYYIKEGVLILYFFFYIYNTYEKKQYVEGARTHLIHFTTVNNRLYNIPEILESLFYIGLMGTYLYFDYGLSSYITIYLTVGYIIVSIWNSSYGKLPSAYFSINKEENIVVCYDGVETYKTPITDIQGITISSKSIILNTGQKKINLIHLSLDEKEIRLISNYCLSQLRTTPTMLSKEEVVELQ